MFAAVLLLVGVISILSPSVCNAVELTGCKAESYCAGDTIMYNCGMDTSDIQIVILDTKNNSAFEAWFNESSEIGDSQNETIGSVTLYYNKTSSMNIRVWFMADASLNGYKFECRDGENSTDVEFCDIDVNNALAYPNLFGLQSGVYCDATNFTWGIAGDTTCLKEFVLRRTNSNDGMSTNITLGANVRSYTGIDQAFAGDDEYCLSIAPRNYMSTGHFSSEQCVQFTVPRRPRELKESYNVDNANQDDEIEVTINWEDPEFDRPNVLAYYITTNITNGDSNGDDDGSGPNMDDDGFRTIMIPGDRTMMKLQGAMEGYYYSVQLVAENCHGNSTSATIKFKVMRPPPTPTTTTTSTSTPTETVSPSASPAFEDDEGLSETLIIVIAVIAVVVFLLIVFLPLIICCCCVCFCGVSIACCASCADSSGDEFEMSGGTKL